MKTERFRIYYGGPGVTRTSAIISEDPMTGTDPAERARDTLRSFAEEAASDGRTEEVTHAVIYRLKTGREHATHARDSWEEFARVTATDEPKGDAS